MAEPEVRPEDVLARSLAFVAIGTPVQQGNHRVNQHGAVYETSKGHGPWRRNVAWSARAAMTHWTQLDEPVRLRCWFSMPKPKSARRDALWPAKQPDLSKLVRSVEDALTDAGVWADDARVVVCEATKVYAGSHHSSALSVPGVVVAVSAAAAEDETLRAALDALIAFDGRGVGVGGAA